LSLSAYHIAVNLMVLHVKEKGFRGKGGERGGGEGTGKKFHFRSDVDVSRLYYINRYIVPAFFPEGEGGKKPTKGEGEERRRGKRRKGVDGSAGVRKLTTPSNTCKNSAAEMRKGY